MARITTALVAAWALAATGAECGRLDTPERVGDRFVDLYFVEIDQARAQALASGLARKKLDDELRLVAEVRRSVSPDQAKPSVSWDRTEAVRQGERARLQYEVHARQGADDTRKHVLLGLERTDGRWTVSNFTVDESAGPPGR